MSFHLEVLGATFTLSEVDLPAAIQGLRGALGKSQQGMAKLLGCSLPAYQKWELGILAPDAQWLLRMLQLCPDEQTRNAFRIRPERRSTPRERAAAPIRLPMSSAERASYRERAHQAVDTICQCGEAGDQGADLRLALFADSLHDAAIYYRQAQDKQ